MNVRLIPGPNGVTLQDTRAPKHVESDRRRCASLMEELGAAYTPEVQERRTFQAAQETFGHLTKGGPKHDFDDTALTDDEKRFIIYAASRSNLFCLAVSIGDWEEAVRLLLAAKSQDPQRDTLRRSVVVKLGKMLTNREEDEERSRLAAENEGRGLAA